MPKNFEGMMVGEFYVGAHTKDPPSKEEWESMLATYESNHPRGALFYTEGGSPSAIQRKQLAECMQRLKHPMKAAILTDSRIARVAITAINLFNKGMATAYPPEEIDTALAGLGASPEMQTEIKKVLRDLNRKLQLPEIKK